MKSKNLHIANGSLSRVRRKAWLAVAGLAVLIFAASSIPGPRLPSANLFPGSDKVVHLIIYAFVGALIARALVRGHALDPGRAVLLTAVLGAAYGLSDEIHQVFVPNRLFELGDLVANAAGTVLGAVAFTSFAASQDR
jgi:VanZ family protein